MLCGLFGAVFVELAPDFPIWSLSCCYTIFKIISRFCSSSANWERFMESRHVSTEKEVWQNGDK